jgi:hypothetical protein
MIHTIANANALANTSALSKSLELLVMRRVANAAAMTRNATKRVCRRA